MITNNDSKMVRAYILMKAHDFFSEMIVKWSAGKPMHKKRQMSKIISSRLGVFLHNNFINNKKINVGDMVTKKLLQSFKDFFGELPYLDVKFIGYHNPKNFKIIDLPLPDEIRERRVQCVDKPWPGMTEKPFDEMLLENEKLRKFFKSKNILLKKDMLAYIQKKTMKDPKRLESFLLVVVNSYKCHENYIWSHTSDQNVRFVDHVPQEIIAPAPTLKPTPYPGFKPRALKLIVKLKLEKELSDLTMIKPKDLVSAANMPIFLGLIGDRRCSERMEKFLKCLANSDNEAQNKKSIMDAENLKRKMIDDEKSRVLALNVMQKDPYYREKMLKEARVREWENATGRVKQYMVKLNDEETIHRYGGKLYYKGEDYEVGSMTLYDFICDGRRMRLIGDDATKFLEVLFANWLLRGNSAVLLSKFDLRRALSAMYPADVMKSAAVDSLVKEVKAHNKMPASRDSKEICMKNLFVFIRQLKSSFDEGKQFVSVNLCDRIKAGSLDELVYNIKLGVLGGTQSVKNYNRRSSWKKQVLVFSNVLKYTLN
jgi:hypothetical protein